MARFFMGGKVYDTEKAEEVMRFRRSFPASLIQGLCYWKDMTLYRTERGNWFSVSKEAFDRQAGHIETEESVKRIFEETNNIEAFERFFGEAEKA